MTTTTEPQVLITPLKPAIIKGMAQKLPVLIRVQAPDADPAKRVERKPYHLSLVIDRSGSMSGEPLIEAVRCAKYIVDQLEPTDLVSLVTFDNSVTTIAGTAPVGDRRHLHRALERIRSGGTTNLHGGWKEGMESLMPGAAGAALARVILLSDGNANEGETTVAEVIANCCADAAAKGVSTSTYGLGCHFNEELMVEMGKRGLGNHYYGETAADLFEPFAEEFDLISNLYAREVRLTFAAPKDIKVTLMNDYAIEYRKSFPWARLPDLPWGAEAWALFELEIPHDLALASANLSLKAGVIGTSIDGVPLAFQDATLEFEAVSVHAWEALLENPLVQSRLTEVAAGKFLKLARSAAAQGDWEDIQKMIAEAQTRFADHPWVMEVLKEMADLAKVEDFARFQKEALYSSGKMSRRLSAKNEVLYDLCADGASASYLRRKKAQGKAQFEGRTTGDGK